MPGEDGNSNAGAGNSEIGNVEDLATLIAELALFVGLPEPSSSRLPAIESTLWAIGPGNFLDAG